MPLKLAEWTRKYGKIFGFQRGCHNVLVLSDQKLAKEVFVEQFENFHERDLNPLLGNIDKRSIAHSFNSRGLRWKRLRVLTSLAFTTKNLKKIFPILTDCSNKMIKNLEKDLESTSTIDLSRNLKQFTADVILSSAFGCHEKREYIEKVINGVLKTIGRVQGRLGPIAWTFPFIGPILFFFNQSFLFLFDEFINKFLAQTKKDIEQRKEAKDQNLNEHKEPKDFIDLLIEAESNEVVLQNGTSYNKKNAQIEKHLTKDEILGTCISFLLGGFDTTSNTLSFSFYYLAKHPEIQEKARNEIEEFCGSEDLDYDTLNKLKYLDAIIKETLRLHPIASAFTSRRCVNAIKIGNLEIEKGTDIILDVVSMHRDKSVWGEDAEEYKPERWLVSNSQNGNFLGFGDGLRICVGMRLAQLEHKIALISILRKYRVIEILETKEAKDVVGILMSPKNLKVKLEKI